MSNRIKVSFKRRFTRDFVSRNFQILDGFLKVENVMSAFLANVVVSNAFNARFPFYSTLVTADCRSFHEFLIQSIEIAGQFCLQTIEVDEVFLKVHQMNFGQTSAAKTEK